MELNEKAKPWAVGATVAFVLWMATGIVMAETQSKVLEILFFILGALTFALAGTAGDENRKNGGRAT